MTNDNNNQEKRERTKTVMLGPDITKEIRSQLEEYNLTKVLNETDNKEQPKEKIEDSLPSSFFYNADNSSDDNSSNINETQNNNNENISINNEDTDYSIFGGDNPIEEIQGSPERNDEEVLVNNLNNKEYQRSEISRSKKETEEIASKIIKDLILDNETPQNSVKDSLIKELEDDNSIFQKFEHKEKQEQKTIDDNFYDTDKDDANNIFDIPSGKIIEKSEEDNSAKVIINDKQENNDDIFDTNYNVNSNINIPHNNQDEFDEYEDRRATRLNLEAKISISNEQQGNRIFWKEETPLVGFLVTFNNNPNGDFYELREGKLVITSQVNKNISSLLINDDSVSLMHAIMKISNDKISLLDQFSENGTTIKHLGDDTMIELSGESEFIKDKDIITFGNVTFKVCLI